jgi:SPP1 gp7 family putative phage head morphogenesis protein
MIERGADAFLDVTANLADAIVSAVSGKRTPAAIRSAINGAARRFGTSKLAAPVQRELLHGAMLGALDASWEADHDRPIAVESFSAMHAASFALGGADTRFASKPMAEAIKSFLQKRAVTREEFDQMQKAAKVRAFTVANAANEEMVKTVKRELIRQIAAGADLDDFGKNAAKRFEQAGWTPSSPSHVETIFRTNTLRAYGEGRARQMLQPDVLAVRPYFQWLGVGDGPPRQRATHAAMHGAVLLASDPFWTRCYPPAGFNCRCRVRSLSAADKTAHSRVETGSGGRFDRMPDEGFASGMSAMFDGDTAPDMPANDPPPPPDKAND